MIKIFGQHDEKTLDQINDVASRAEKAALMADPCGNAAIRTNLKLADIQPRLSSLADDIQQEIRHAGGRS